MTPEISIIVPVYNVEKYLRRCVDSILAQTFRSFECILIDDGSPDSCPAICDEYVAKDPRIQVIHQKNAGVSVARNAGLAVARGNWIGFVDSDDWIEPEAYETAYNTAKEKNADLVQWNVSSVKDNGKQRRYFGSKEGYFSIADDDTYFCGSMCHKLILKKLICDNNITFPQDIRLSEDEIFACQCYMTAFRCYHLENVFYYYKQRDESAIHNISREMIFERVTVLNMMQDIITLRGLENSDWKKIVLERKEQAKLLSIFSLDKPDFNLYYSLFPECTRTMIKRKGKNKLIFLLLYFHQQFIAAMLIKLWNLLKGYK